MGLAVSCGGSIAELAMSGTEHAPVSSHRGCPCSQHLAMDTQCCREGIYGRKSEIVSTILNTGRKILEAGAPLLYYHLFRSED